MNHTEELEKERKETALVRRAQAGDAEAFDTLARHYRAVLRALAFLRTSDLQEAEDLTQEVLTRAWQKLPLLNEPRAFLPWLKAIVANACNSWYRRSRFSPISLNGEPERQFLMDPDVMPLQALLAKERDRELRQALVSLPEANRLALMMHVWGGYSYEEIAQFAGVPLTTVEGRIHRARRQLQRLLRDEGALFLGEPRRNRQNLTVPGIDRQRTPIMIVPHASPVSQDLAQPYALVQFSYRFATLVELGFSLVRTLDTLREIPSPYGEAADEIRKVVEEGHTLSLAMSRRPELFTPFYIGLVRAGEVGGMLEETLRRAANLITKEWKLMLRNPGKEDPLFFISPFSKPLPDDWEDLSSYQQSATLILLCETFGLLLRSGVPILQAMETTSALLPQTQKAGMLAAREAIRTGERITPGLERIGILPRFAIEMIAKGEKEGSLDLMLERAGEIVQHELECRLMAEEQALADSTTARRESRR